MKKAILYIALISLLSGCAKVTQDSIPCTGANSSFRIYVPNSVSGIGTSVQLDYSSYYSVYSNNFRLYVKGPSGFSANSVQGVLNIPINSASNYGLYTAVTYLNGCAGPTDTFYITSAYTGTPPCTVTSHNLLLCSLTSFDFTGAAYGYSASSYYDINTTSNNGYTYDCYTQSAPSSGTYYNLVSTPYTLNATQACVQLSGLGNVYYQSAGGYVYFTTKNGIKYMTFCSATFQQVSTSQYFTLTGDVQYQ